MIEDVASSARAAPPPAPDAPGADISIVMITMNEEKAVGKVIGDIRTLLPATEIVIVDSS